MAKHHVHRFSPLGKRMVMGSILLAITGVLLTTGGIIYNEISGFSRYTRLIEGEVTILPSLPFVIKLNHFRVEAPVQGAPGAVDTGAFPPNPQRIELSLLQNGQVLEQVNVEPGRPAAASGVSLKLSDADTGWAFTLVVRDPGGREKVVPIKPWDPEMIRLGLTRQLVFADSVRTIEPDPEQDASGKPTQAVEVFLVEQNGDRQFLGFATETAPVSASGYMVSPWNIRPYTGLRVVGRPGNPLLMAGIVCLVIGLVLFGLLLGIRTRPKTKLK